MASNATTHRGSAVERDGIQWALQRGVAKQHQAEVPGHGAEACLDGLHRAPPAARFRCQAVDAVARRLLVQAVGGGAPPLNRSAAATTTAAEPSADPPRRAGIARWRRARWNRRARDEDARPAPAACVEASDVRDMCDRLREARVASSRAATVWGDERDNPAKCQSAPRVFTSCLVSRTRRSQENRKNRAVFRAVDTSRARGSARGARSRTLRRRSMASFVPALARASLRVGTRRVSSRLARASPRSRSSTAASLSSAAAASSHPPRRPRCLPVFGAAIARPWAEALVELSQPSATDATLDLATGTGTSRSPSRTPSKRRRPVGPNAGADPGGASEGSVASVLGLDKDRHAPKRANEAFSNLRSPKVKRIVHFSRASPCVGGRCSTRTRRGTKRRSECMSRARIARSVR